MRIETVKIMRVQNCWELQGFETGKNNEGLKLTEIMGV